jgi:uncharacterized protein YndB with AHSA1/START domain
MDLRTDGKWRYVMIDADGTEYPVKGVFREIVPFERIVSTDEFDEGFEKVMNADLPRELFRRRFSRIWLAKPSSHFALCMSLPRSAASTRRWELLAGGTPLLTALTSSWRRLESPLPQLRWLTSGLCETTQFMYALLCRNLIDQEILL